MNTNETVKDVNYTLVIEDINTRQPVLPSVERVYPIDFSTHTLNERLFNAKCRYIDELNADHRMVTKLADYQWVVVAEEIAPEEAEARAVAKASIGAARTKLYGWLNDKLANGDYRGVRLAYLVVANQGVDNPKVAKKIIAQNGHFIGLNEDDCEELKNYIQMVKGMAVLVDFDLDKELYEYVHGYAKGYAPRWVDFIEKYRNQFLFLKTGVTE